MEYSLRQSEENFTKAQSTIVQLQESKENLENKNRDLEAKLFELIEKEQSAEERARYFVTHFDKKIHIDLHYKDKISPSRLNHKSVGFSFMSVNLQIKANLSF